MTINPPFPPVFRAAEIALVAIKQNRVNNWAELIAAGIDTRLDDAQLALVREYEKTVVSHLSVAKGAPVTITWCPGCGRIAFMGAGTSPAKCTLTQGCEVKPLKAGAPAPRTKPELAA